MADRLDEKNKLQRKNESPQDGTINIRSYQKNNKNPQQGEPSPKSTELLNKVNKAFLLKSNFPGSPSAPREKGKRSVLPQAWVLEPRSWA